MSHAQYLYPKRFLRLRHPAADPGYRTAEPTVVPSLQSTKHLDARTPHAVAVQSLRAAHSCVSELAMEFLANSGEPCQALFLFANVHMDPFFLHLLRQGQGKERKHASASASVCVCVVGTHLVRTVRTCWDATCMRATVH